MEPTTKLLTARFRRPGALQRAGRSLVLAAGLCLPLGGCYDMELRQSLRLDGTLAAGADIRFDGDMQDVFAFFEAYLDIQPETPPGLTRDGLCGALNQLARLSPPGGAPQLPPMTGRQFREGDRFTCQMEVGLGSIGEAVSKLQSNPAMLFSPYRVRAEGDRRLRIVLDLTTLPEPEDLLRLAIMGMLADTGRRHPPGTPPPPMPSPEKVADLARKYKAAMLASSRMLGRDRTISLAVTAPRIIETNGELSGDRTSVRFRFTWLEMTNMLLDKEARRKGNLFVIAEY